MVFTGSNIKRDLLVIIKRSIDACGLKCPQPLLKTRQGLQGIKVGECLEVLFTDNASVEDFQKMAKLTGHSLLLFEELVDSYRYVLQKGEVNQ